MFRTAHTFEIILPSEPMRISADDADAAHRYVEGFLTEVFGGFTAYDAAGGWRDASGVITGEDVTVYRASIQTDLDPQQYRNAIATLAQNIKAQCKEQAVFVSHRREDVGFF